MTAATGWERITDPSDQRRTVWWRRSLPDGTWLAVSRRSSSPQWRWQHRGPNPHKALATCGDLSWPNSQQARRAADAYYPKNEATA